MNILVVSSSLNPESRSRVVGSRFASALGKEEVDVEVVDLMESPLPFCDGGGSYGHPSVVATKALVEKADAIVFAGPIYVYGVNAVQKNFVELFGRSMQGKLAGFLCAAGGAMSYMSVMPFANALMLDFRMIVMPRFVYVTGQDWNGDALKADIAARLDQFVAEYLALARKLAD